MQESQMESKALGYCECLFVFTESSSVDQLSSHFFGFLENPCEDRKHVFSLQSRSLNKGLNVKPHVFSESSLNKLTIEEASFTFLLIFNYEWSTKKFRNDVDVKQFFLDTLNDNYKKNHFQSFCGNNECQSF